MRRIHANTQAIEELRRWHTFTGRLSAPFLMLESTGDDWLVEAHREYADLVRRAGREQLLKQLWVKRAGHCPFTAPEVQAALSTLIERLGSDSWDSSPIHSWPVAGESQSGHDRGPSAWPHAAVRLRG